MDNDKKSELVNRKLADSKSDNAIKKEISDKLIVDIYESLDGESYIEEKLDDKDKANREMRLKIKVSEVNKKNGNGRYYSKPVMEREVKKLNELIQKRAVFSAADHPEKGVKPSIRNVSAVPKRMWMDGDNVWAEVDIPKTDAGKDLSAIIRAGGRPGVSTRAMGTVSEQTVNIGGKDEVVQMVNDDYDLRSFDFVIGQSEPSAGIYGITEQLEREENDLVNETITTSSGGSTKTLVSTPPSLTKADVETCVQEFMDKHIQGRKENKQMTLKEWIAKYGDAHKDLQESLKSVNVEELQALHPQMYEAFREATITAVEEEVNQKVFAHIDEFCEGIREDIKDEEIAEAKAVGAVEFLSEIGIDEATDAATMMNDPKMIAAMRAVLAAISSSASTRSDPADQDVTVGASTGKGSTGPGSSKKTQTVVKEELERSPVIAAMNERLEAAEAKLNEATETATSTSKKLAEAETKAAVAGYMEKFPYNEKVKAKIRTILESCESAEEVKEIYEAQIGILQESGIKEETKRGSAKFLYSDDKDGKDEDDGNSISDPHSVRSGDQLINEAAEDFVVVDSGNKEEKK